MIYYISIIISAACFGIIFAEVSPIPMWIKKALKWTDTDYFGNKYYKQLKPLDCYVCMAFWSAFFLFLFNEDAGIILSVLYACAASVFSSIIYKLTK